MTGPRAPYIMLGVALIGAGLISTPERRTEWLRLLSSACLRAGDILRRGGVTAGLVYLDRTRPAPATTEQT